MWTDVGIPFRIQPYKTAQGLAEGAVLQLLDIDRLKRSIEELSMHATMLKRSSKPSANHCWSSTTGFP